MTGQWSGSGWLIGRDGIKQEFDQTEDVEFRLDNTALIIEGKCKTRGIVSHHAFAVVTFNKETDDFNFQSWLANGNSGTFKAEIIEKRVSATEKEMMGGLSFMVDEKMCVGIVKNNLMARIGPEKYNEALRQKGCKEMNFTGRTMKGFVFVEPEGIDMDSELEYWIQLCLDYNPLAKSSKKKKDII